MATRGCSRDQGYGQPVPATDVWERDQQKSGGTDFRWEKEVHVPIDHAMPLPNVVCIALQAFLHEATLI